MYISHQPFDKNRAAKYDEVNPNDICSARSNIIAWTEHQYFMSNHNKIMLSHFVKISDGTLISGSVISRLSKILILKSEHQYLLSNGKICAFTFWENSNLFTFKISDSILISGSVITRLYQYFVSNHKNYAFTFW